MSDVVARDGAVVSGCGLAAQAGADILGRGGNAIDAAVATALVECVVQPANVGIGGYAGTAVFYSAKDKAVISLDFDGFAPMAATPDMFVGKPAAVSERGYLAVVAPPIIGGLAALLENYGTMSFADVAAEAHRLADEGFPASKAFAASMSKLLAEGDEDSARAIMPDMRAPEEGEIFAQKDLAKLIDRMRREGPEIFYSGDIPRTIASAIQKHGGIVSEEDFSVVRPQFGEALSVKSGDFEVFTPAPPSGGLTSLEILNVINLAGDVSEVDLYRLFIEGGRHAWADRLGRLGDPAFVDMPISRLLSQEHAGEILGSVRAGEAASFGGTDASGGEHTVHLVTMDKQGNAVSLTETQGMWLGSYVGIPGTGLLLGNGMSRFDLQPGRANSIAPGKRMLHNMCPLLITRNGQPFSVMGLPGGRKIVNVAALIAYAVTRMGRTCGEAISMPRYHVEGPGDAWLSSEDLIARLKDQCGSDYPVKLASAIAGPVAGIMRRSEDAGMLAASEHGSGCVCTI